MPSCRKNIPKVGAVSQLWSTLPAPSLRLGPRHHPVHRRVPKRSYVSRKKLVRKSPLTSSGKSSIICSISLSVGCCMMLFFLWSFFLSSGVFPNLFFVSLSLSVAQTIEDSGSSESICLSKNYSLCYCLPLFLSFSLTLRTI